jgi:hypothetical protein
LTCAAGKRGGRQHLPLGILPALLPLITARGGRLRSVWRPAGDEYPEGDRGSIRGLSPRLIQQPAQDHLVVSVKNGANLEIL